MAMRVRGPSPPPSMASRTATKRIRVSRDARCTAHVLLLLSTSVTSHLPRSRGRRRLPPRSRWHTRRRRQSGPWRRGCWGCSLAVLGGGREGEGREGRGGGGLERSVLRGGCRGGATCRQKHFHDEGGGVGGCCCRGCCYVEGSGALAASDGKTWRYREFKWGKRL